MEPTITFTLDDKHKFTKGALSGLSELEIVQAALELAPMSTERFATLATVSRASRVLQLTNTDIPKDKIFEAVHAIHQANGKASPYFVMQYIMEKYGIRIDPRTITRFMGGTFPDLIEPIAGKKRMSLNEYLLNYNARTSD